MSYVPHPREPLDHRPADAVPTGAAGAVVVHRGLPGDRATWARRAAVVAGLLVALADAEGGGLVLPAPLAGRRTLRAWSRAAERAVAAAGDADAVVVVHLADADVLAAAGGELAAVLRREREARRGGTPAGPPVTELAAVLHGQARRQDLPVEQLVAELGRAARVLAPAHLRHGVPATAPATRAAAG
ncbi:hypothetical protein [Pseudonocardia spirodelae]|uniref:ANTAR domain-containing protein n=1 Tax=Pseudonocardia spirodelae TaxID=3133431 RepID=A0ABU8T146_9PSEU